MKQSKEFLNLPVMSMTEGKSVGITQAFVIDANTRKAVDLIVKTKDWYTGVKFIPVEQILGVGKDALMIERSNNIIPYRNVQSSDNLLKEDISIIGATIISSEGIKKGKVVEYLLDDSYSIIKLLAVNETNDNFEIDINDVSVISKEYVILKKEQDTTDETNELNNTNMEADKNIDTNASKNIEKEIDQFVLFHEKAFLKEPFQFGKKTLGKGTPITKALLREVLQCDKKKFEELISNYIEDKQ